MYIYIYIYNITKPDDEGFVFWNATLMESRPVGGAGAAGCVFRLRRDHSLAKYLEPKTPMIQQSFDMSVRENVAVWQIYSQQFSEFVDK